MAVSSGFSNPVGFAVDANDNLFVGDTTANAVQEIPYTGGYRLVDPRRARAVLTGLRPDRMRSPTGSPCAGWAGGPPTMACPAW